MGPGLFSGTILRHLWPARGRTSLLWFALTTLLGAFLVFQVQPVISKCVLPWFGGSPAVWTTCMLFFQVLLFGGYLYAHLLRSRLSPRLQATVHLSLLITAAWLLPIEPQASWKPAGDESPTWYLLTMLAAHVGLPYFVLSSTGPLVQAWLSYYDSSEKVYRLYALSNVGSLAALLTYPFLIEPALSVSAQTVIWSLSFCAFVLVQGIVATGLLGIEPTDVSSDEQQPADQSTERNTGASPDLAGSLTSGAPHPTGTSHSGTRGSLSMPRRSHSASGEQDSLVRQAVWLGLPALASTMLLVVTNHVCQDIAVIPFLWILPLSIYLVSFIVCFESPERYRPKLISAFTLFSLGAIHMHEQLPRSTQLLAEAGAYMMMLLGVCLLCHGEVARLKPDTTRLTKFYAMVSGGGALGGVLVAIICPLLFDSFAELPVIISLATALTFLLFFSCRGWREAVYDWDTAKRLRFAAIAILVAPLIAVWWAPRREVVASERNFFGVLQVTRDERGLRLVHGTTIHGVQLSGDAASQPTSYYGRESGIGRAIAALQERDDSLQIGVVGLGCGVLATYGRPSDTFDLIEINPAVLEIAKTHFTFLKSSEAHLRTHLGDGRLVLERMVDARFDLLVLDAFSSDSIPAHLLTREAMTLYQQRLAAGGVIAVHVSNNHLDLVPLVHRLASDIGLRSGSVLSRGVASKATRQAEWVLLADRENPIWHSNSLSVAKGPARHSLRQAPLWTDQHHNLVSVLKLW